MSFGLPSLLVRFGVKADTFVVKDFAAAIGKIPFSVAGAIGSLAGLSIGFADLTKTVMDMSVNLGNFHAITGLNIDTLQRWQQVAKSAGISGDIVASSILNLNNAISQLHLGNGAMLKPLGRLGIGYHGQNAYQLLDEIKNAARNPRMRPGDVTTLMGQLHVDPQMMRLFTMPGAQFNSEFNRAPLINNSEQKSLQEFQAALADFTNILIKEFVPVLVGVEPYLKDLAVALGDVIKILGAGAQGGLHGLHYMRQIANVTAAPLFPNASRSLDTTMDRLMASAGIHVNGAPTNVNVTQNIHGVKDSDEVATMVIDGVKKHVTRGMTQASKNFNNQGY